MFSLLKVEVKGQKVVAKVGTVAYEGMVSPEGTLLIWVFLAFYIFPEFGSCCHPGYHDSTCFFYVGL
jgi:hypothetical protein